LEVVSRGAGAVFDGEMDETGGRGRAIESPQTAPASLEVQKYSEQNFLKLKNKDRTKNRYLST